MKCILVNEVKIGKIPKISTRFRMISINPQSFGTQNKINENQQCIALADTVDLKITIT